MRAIALVAVLVLSIGGVAGAQGSAESGTSYSNGTITVRIDLAVGPLSGEIEPVPPEGQALADELAAKIENYWNAGLTAHQRCGLAFTLDVDIDMVDTDSMRPAQRTEDYIGLVTNPGRHTILWSDPGIGHGEPAWPEIYDPYDLDETAGHDSTSPWLHDLDGVWSSHLGDDRDFAHEVGHLMGLGDDYDDATQAIASGREGTLMGDGDMVDQALVDRLADVMRSAGIELPACWTGTMQINLFKDYLAEQHGLPPATCEGSWALSLSFAVAGDDSISGNAHAQLASGPDCTFEIPGNTSAIEFTVAGTASADGFALDFTQAPVEAPGDFMGIQGAMAATTFQVERVSATHAQSDTPIATTEAGPFPVTGNATISLDCSSCN
jgi:hypothetical protein